MSVVRASLMRVVFAVASSVAACGDESGAHSSDRAGLGEDANSPASASESEAAANSVSEAPAQRNTASGSSTSTEKPPAAGGSNAAAGSGGTKRETELGELAPPRDAGVSGDATGLPRTYKISFNRPGCNAPCPVYSVSIDQDGNVEFDGQARVAKAGKSAKKVAPADAADVYEALLEAKYFDFEDAYTFQQMDLCMQFATDAPTHNWSVERDGKTKVLSHNLGCKVKGLDEVEAVKGLLLDKSGVVEWIGSNN